MPIPVGIIGTGNMGGAMAQNLLARGWTVRVYDPDTPKITNLERFGAIASVNSCNVAIDSEVVIVCVVDAAQTEEALFGAHGVTTGLQPGRTVLLCPTIAPADTERFAQRLAALGVHTIDAPMSGGPVRARDGTMSLMVACEDAHFDAHRELLDALANPVFRVSQRVGDGARTKLVNNLLAAINLAGAAEVMVLAQQLGLNLGTTLDVIERSSGQSWIGMERMRRAVAGDLEPARAHVTLLEKDSRLALAEALAAGADAPLGAQASRVFERAHLAGLAEADDAVLFRFLGGV